MAKKINRSRIGLFFPFSLVLHLFIFTIVSALYPQVNMDSLPRFHLEVSLLPFISEERRPSPSHSISPVKKEIKKEEEKSTVHEEKAEILPLKESENPIISESLTQTNPMPSTAIDIQPSHSSHKEESEIMVATNQTHIPNPLPQRESSPLAKVPSFSEDLLMVQPKYAENPKPLYPQEARRKGYEGEVVLRVEVLSDGRVGGIEVKHSSGYEILDRSALKAVKQWRFVPAKKGEKAISQWVNIPIKFQLQ